MTASRRAPVTAVLPTTLLLTLSGIAWGAAPSEATPTLRQMVSATVAVPAAGADVLVVCTDGECERVALPASRARNVALVVRHAVSPRDPLPDAGIVAGKPLPRLAAGCAGELGIAVTFSKTADSRAQLVAEVLLDGVPVTSRTSTANEGERNRSSSVCFPAA